LKSADLQQKTWEANLDAEVKIILEQMKGGGAADLEKLRAHLKEAPILEQNKKIDGMAEMHKQSSEMFIDALEKALSGVAEHLNAPREIVRDAQGRLSGVKTINQVRNIKRDAEGKVQGLE
jgi:GTP1/Obg family GTP-binding protein